MQKELKKFLYTVHIINISYSSKTKKIKFTTDKVYKLYHIQLYYTL